MHKRISNAEKAVSVLSYFSMGIVGLIWIVIGYFINKRLKPFLMYNITQSIFISLFLAFFNFLINKILQIILSVPHLSDWGISVNMFLQSRIQIFALSFNKIETVVFFLLIYISVGVFMGKNFYIPFLSDLTKKIIFFYK